MVSYSVTANYYWLLVEGLYLGLVLRAMNPNKNHKLVMRAFLVLGWGKLHIVYFKDIKYALIMCQHLALTLLWCHGVNMTPGLFDRLNIPNFENISFHLALYFLCRFLSTVSIHSILISMLHFL